MTAGLIRLLPGRAPAPVLGALLAGLLALPAVAAQPELRVCADPNNLPFSDRNGEGFENELAELVARELGMGVSYTWWAQRRGFIRNTLKAEKCDVIMGVPAELEMVETTTPYYRSTYVFVSRAKAGLHISSISDSRLGSLRIGVHLIGDDGANTPPVHALGEQGIVENVVGYTIYGDYREQAPPSRVIHAVEDGDIDIAAVWGPLGGYFAKRSPVPLEVSQIHESDRFAPFRFQYDIAMGVRKGDDRLKARLDDVIARKRTEIREILARYGVPVLPPSTGTAQAGAQDDDAD